MCLSNTADGPAPNSHSPLRLTHAVRRSPGRGYSGLGTIARHQRILADDVGTAVKTADSYAAGGQAASAAWGARPRRLAPVNEPGPFSRPGRGRDAGGRYREVPLPAAPPGRSRRRRSAVRTRSGSAPSMETCWERSPSPERTTRFVSVPCCSSSSPPGSGERAPIRMRSPSTSTLTGSRTYWPEHTGWASRCAAPSTTRPTRAALRGRSRRSQGGDHPRGPRRVLEGALIDPRSRPGRRAGRHARFVYTLAPPATGMRCPPFIVERAMSGRADGVQRCRG